MTNAVSRSFVAGWQNQTHPEMRAQMRQCRSLSAMNYFRGNVSVQRHFVHGFYLPATLYADTITRASFWPRSPYDKQVKGTDVNGPEAVLRIPSEDGVVSLTELDGMQQNGNEMMDFGQMSSLLLMAPYATCSTGGHGNRCAMHNAGVVLT